MFAFYKEFREINVLLAEAPTLRYGLQLCVGRSVSKLETEVDSELLVHLVGRFSRAGWPQCNVIRDIHQLLKGLGTPVSHVYHEAN